MFLTSLGFSWFSPAEQTAATQPTVWSRLLLLHTTGLPPNIQIPLGAGMACFLHGSVTPGNFYHHWSDKEWSGKHLAPNNAWQSFRTIWIMLVCWKSQVLISGSVIYPLEILYRTSCKNIPTQSRYCLIIRKQHCPSCRDQSWLLLRWTVGLILHCVCCI